MIFNHMKKYIIALIGAICLCLLSFLFFDKSIGLIFIVIAIGVVSGVLSKLFTGYVIPNQFVFHSRFIIYGIGSGLMIGMLLFLVRSLELNLFSLHALMLNLVVSIPIGVIITGSFLYLGFRTLKKRTMNIDEDQDSISDQATYTDSSCKTFKGRLVLAKCKLMFFEMPTGDCIFEYGLDELNPEIKRSGFLNIPKGFNIGDELAKLNVAFPYYWIDLIKNNKHFTSLP
ncbi:hypothetical protein LX69_00455 [Breznakibacter xylanolyticus]|uniref:Uncharacterized protein n=2 Tax=Breznakibacter xylanolyticus TaxID=990 RepID=A0A2W7NHU8_9BACT|nr:hypothetical protein LX69_00455 [Breznakibacter xylanolyticus]